MEFREFFRLATGQEPYEYQCQVAEDGLPEVLEVPTGTGKTHGVLAGWLYRRFVHPDLEVRAGTPRRLVYALPMGVLVEAVTADITDMWHRLDEARGKFDTPLPTRLPILQLMGGTLTTADVSGWRVGMDAPSVVVGTVDQVVSRQLMRGYGASRRTYPIDFALVTNGAHVIVDEIQLCGQATSTARQVAAFQELLHHPAEPVGLTCMSATAEGAYLDTVDNPWHEPPAIRLTATDRNGQLKARLDATRRVRRLDGEPKEADVAAAAIDLHRSGTLTLVVVNRVDEAVTIHDALRRRLGKVVDAPRLLLVHSRFRAHERTPLNEQLRELTGSKGVESMLGTPGVMVVATQTVEAGIDLDAATLITEAAAWPSVCQRAGRCNRAGAYGAGEDTAASLYWYDAGNPAPYEKADVTASVAALNSLEGAVVTSEDLRSHAVVRSPDPLSILRSPTFEQLFDTSPDLTGGDIDISRYIRSDRDTDVRVAWIDASAIAVDAEPVLARPSPEWQVAVPVSAMRAFLKRKAWPRAWIYDTFDERWTRVGSETVLRPQDLVLIDREDGGYDPVTGYTPMSATRVAPIHTDGTVSSAAVQQTQGTDSGADDAGADPATFIASGWQRLDDHLREAMLRAEALCADLDMAANLGDDVERAVIAAAALHDLGKSFPGWQDALRETWRDEHGRYTDVIDPPSGVLAKSPAQVRTKAAAGKSSEHDSAPERQPRRRLTVRADPLPPPRDTSAASLESAHEGRRPLRRRVFRHELVSVLQVRTSAGRELLGRMGVSPRRHPLVDYLIGAHHGVLRVTPRDPVVDGRNGSMFLGVVDGEWIPPADIGEASLPGVIADLSIFSGGEGSWGLESARLVEEFGPFRLAYLETVVRMSDWRASGALPATEEVR